MAESAALIQPHEPRGHLQSFRLDSALPVEDFTPYFDRLRQQSNEIQERLFMLQETIRTALQREQEPPRATLRRLEHQVQQLEQDLRQLRADLRRLRPRPPAS